MTETKGVGVVAIGRNEGLRLRRCLQVLQAADASIVYVDSGSSDGSRELARSLGADVVELDSSLPFTAARARNEGFQRLEAVQPDVDFVQFIDGDCELVDGWFEAALQAMNETLEVAVVCGRRRERHPEQSVYNRIIDAEWDTPIGDAASCGGDALFRATAFEEIGGFNESIAAGEEPELSQRLRQSGKKIVRIDAEMTLHDAAVTRFSQWWRRHVRSGYGGLDVQQRLGVHGFDRELVSARRWTLGWLGFLLLGMAMLGWVFGLIGLMAAITASIGLWMLQMLRVSRHFSARRFSLMDSLHAACITMAIKWANLFGQACYWRDQRAGRAARLIEYKSCGRTMSNVRAGSAR